MILLVDIDENKKNFANPTVVKNVIKFFVYCFIFLEVLQSQYFHNKS